MEDLKMKFAKYFSLVATVTMLLSLSALAADKHEGNFTLTETAQIGSTQLQAGDYKAQWSGTGQDVQVQIIQHGKTLVTVPGKLVDNKEASPYNSVTLKPVSGSEKTVDEIDFANRKEVLVLSQAQTSGE
jgi:hypothetical protein